MFKSNVTIFKRWNGSLFQFHFLVAFEKILNLLKYPRYTHHTFEEFKFPFISIYILYDSTNQEKQSKINDHITWHTWKIINLFTILHSPRITGMLGKIWSIRISIVMKLQPPSRSEPNNSRKMYRHSIHMENRA